MADDIDIINIKKKLRHKYAIRLLDSLKGLQIRAQQTVQGGTELGEDNWHEVQDCGYSLVYPTKELITLFQKNKN
jgi:hypothetical protein